jgi:hypothetical protein
MTAIEYADWRRGGQGGSAPLTNQKRDKIFMQFCVLLPNIEVAFWKTN